MDPYSTQPDSAVPASCTLQDEIKATVDNWSRRKKLLSLAYLYALLDVKIDSIAHQVGNEMKKELAAAKI